ncbi:hypothetical protein [Oceaniglobus ichthyenteri]|uniref:hypothetical protein n=1 Tax=Oceaniglobus ichthyenteri TaxID=2136177 RepID=UPI000D3825EF|nr:hypothetical protein [Oceaniglobus ichthyenteri]
MALVLPFAGLIGLAIIVPFALAQLLPEGVPGLVVNGALSALALTLSAAGYFLWAYGRQDSAVMDAIGFAPGRTLGYFLRLGLAASLIWGPPMILALGAQPRRWRHVQW